MVRNEILNLVKLFELPTTFHHVFDDFDNYFCHNAINQTKEAHLLFYTSRISAAFQFGVSTCLLMNEYR
jgi:hypothetical protein